MLAQRIIPELESADEPTLNHDSSTNNLIRRYRKLKASQVKGISPTLTMRRNLCNSEWLGWEGWAPTWCGG